MSSSSSFWTFKCFLTASRTGVGLIVDGTDEEEEGIWKFTSTDEEPYLSFPDGVLTGSKDCLTFLSANKSIQTACDHRSNYAIFCESEGKVQNHS